MKKAVKIAIAVVVVIIIAILIYPVQDKKDVKQMVLESSLLYSDNVLQTEKLSDLASLSHEDAVKEMEKLAARWKQLEDMAADMENMAGDDEVAYNFIETAHAEDVDTRSVIEKMYDAAPPGKRIKTLAKMLGVSAKEAYALLKAEETKSAAYWDKEGDRAENLESAARGVKNACKVGLYVGGIVATGGTAGAASLLADASAIITGIDLALEIGEDSVNIYTGYNSDYTVVFSQLRTMTKPAATLMGFATLDVSDAEGALAATSFVIDQYLSLKNDNEFLGMKIDKLAETRIVDKIATGDIDKWLDENGMDKKPDRAAVVAKITAAAEKIEAPEVKAEVKKEEEKKSEEKAEANAGDGKLSQEGILGDWYTVNMANNQKGTAPMTFKSDGTAVIKVQAANAVTTLTYNWTINEGVVIIVHKEMQTVMYYKIIDNNTMEWVKTAFGQTGKIAEPGKEGLVGNRLIRE